MLDQWGDLKGAKQGSSGHARSSSKGRLPMGSSYPRFAGPTAHRKLQDKDFADLLLKDCCQAELVSFLSLDLPTFSSLPNASLNIRHQGWSHHFLYRLASAHHPLAFIFIARRSPVHPQLFYPRLRCACEKISLKYRNPFCASFQKSSKKNALTLCIRRILHYSFDLNFYGPKSSV